MIQKEKKSFIMLVQVLVHRLLILVCNLYEYLYVICYQCWLCHGLNGLKRSDTTSSHENDRNVKRVGEVVTAQNSCTSFLFTCLHLLLLFCLFVFVLFFHPCAFLPFFSEFYWKDVGPGFQLKKNPYMDPSRRCVTGAKIQRNVGTLFCKYDFSDGYASSLKQMPQTKPNLSTPPPSSSSWLPTPQYLHVLFSLMNPNGKV